MPNPNRYRCPQCRTRRTDPSAMVLHVMECSRPLCTCMRVPHPHRPASFPLCEQNAGSAVLVAERMGATPEQLDDLELGLALAGHGKRYTTAEAPF